MSGLLKTAITFLKRHGLYIEDSHDIPASERNEILTQIEELIDGSKTEIGTETFAYKPKKSGAGLPVIINVVAIIAVLGGAYLLFMLFQQREENIVSGAADIVRTEASLLEAVKSDLENEISEKEQEISSIQTKFNELNAERDRIKANAAAQIRQREAELRRALEQEMDIELQRLREEGVSQENMGARLAEIERQKTLEFERQLKSFREETEAEVAEREATIQRLQEEYEQSIRNAELERQNLEATLVEREEELRAQMAAETEALESKRLAAVEELNRFQALREREQLVLDQILTLYENINRNIESENRTAALANLKSLEDFLNDENIAFLPAVQRRKEVEFFLIGSLRELISKQQEELDTQSLIAAANVLSTVSNIVQEADAYYQAGNREIAEQMYRRAINEIPAIRESYNRLSEYQQQDIDGEWLRLAQVIEVGNARFENEDYEGAVASYTQVLNEIQRDIEPMDNMVSKIMSAGFLLGSAEQQAEQDRLAIGEVNQGNALFEQGQYARAIGSYASVIRSYPNSRYVRNAVLGIQQSRDALIQRFESEVADAEERAAGFRQEALAYAEEVDELGQKSEEYESAIAGYENQIEGYTEEIGAYKSEIESYQGQIEGYEGEISDYREQITGYEGTIAEYEETVTGYEGQIAGYEEELADYGRQVEEYRSQAHRYEDELESVSSELDTTVKEKAVLAQKTTRVTQNLQSTRQNYTASLNEAAGSDRFSQEDLLALLETKLIMKQLAQSREVRVQYPELYDKLEDYFDVYGEEQWNEGRNAALEDVLKTIDSLLDIVR